METKVRNKNKFLMYFTIFILGIVFLILIFPMRKSILTSINDDSDKRYTVTYTDGVEGTIVFPDQSYEYLKEGDSTPVYFGTVKREGYEFEGWILSSNESQSMKWFPKVNPIVEENDAKVYEEILYDQYGEITYTAKWKKLSEDIGSPTVEELEEILGNAVKVIDETKKDGIPLHEEKIYLPNGHIGEPYYDETDKSWKIEIIIDGNDYADIYSSDTNELHELLIDENQTRIITLIYKDKAWQSNEPKDTILEVFKVKCNDVIEEEPDDNEPPKKTYTVIYKDEYGSFPNQTTSSLAEGENTPKFKEAAGLTEVLEDGTVIPVREGYRFLGWTKKINEIVSEKDANENNEIIYIAVWQKIGESNEGNIEQEPSEDTNITPEENTQANISNPATEDKIFKYIILAIISTTLFLIITIRLIPTNPKKLN